MQLALTVTSEEHVDEAKARQEDQQRMREEPELAEILAGSVQAGVNCAFAGGQDFRDFGYGQVLKIAQHHDSAMFFVQFVERYPNGLFLFTLDDRILRRKLLLQIQPKNCS